MKTPGEVFENFKSWLNSKTIWGIVVAIIPVAVQLVAQLTGFLFDYEGVVEDITETVGVLDNVWVMLVQFVAAVVAIYGRFVARFKLK